MSKSKGINKYLMNLINVLAAIGIMLVANILGVSIANLFPEGLPARIVNAIVYCGSAIGLAALYGRYLIKMDTETIGLHFKKRDLWLLIPGVLLPVAVLLFYAFVIPGEVIAGDSSRLPMAFVNGFFRSGLTAGIVEELCFRGVIFRYMKKTLGTRIAVIVPAVVFAALHIMNMESFNVADVLLLLLAGSSVSVMFTVMALKSGSIWPGAFAHALWNTMMIGEAFGIGPIVNGGPNTAVIRIMPDSVSKFVTGGNFGVEAAVPAIAGYVIVAVIVLMAGSRKHKKK